MSFLRYPPCFYHLLTVFGVTEYTRLVCLFEWEVNPIGSGTWTLGAQIEKYGEVQGAGGSTSLEVGFESLKPNASPTFLLLHHAWDWVCELLASWSCFHVSCVQWTQPPEIISPNKLSYRLLLVMAFYHQSIKGTNRATQWQRSACVWIVSWNY